MILLWNRVQFSIIWKFQICELILLIWFCCVKFQNNALILFKLKWFEDQNIYIFENELICFYESLQYFFNVSWSSFTTSELPSYCKPSYLCFIDIYLFCVQFLKCEHWFHSWLLSDSTVLIMHDLNMTLIQLPIIISFVDQLTLIVFLWLNSDYFNVHITALGLLSLISYVGYYTRYKIVIGCR